jgi:hypothetical protein
MWDSLLTGLEPHRRLRSTTASVRRAHAVKQESALDLAVHGVVPCLHLRCVCSRSHPQEDRAADGFEHGGFRSNITSAESVPIDENARPLKPPRALLVHGEEVLRLVDGQWLGVARRTEHEEDERKA